MTMSKRPQKRAQSIGELRFPSWHNIDLAETVRQLSEYLTPEKLENGRFTEPFFEVDTDERNNACNCHPEMEVTAYVLNIRALRDETHAERRERVLRERKQVASTRATKRADAAKAKQRAEKQQRAHERLKEKYAS